MLGAIIGDIVGSVYEWDNIKTKDFPLFSDKGFFTDDTVMTIAVADALLSGGADDDFIDSMKKFGKLYPDSGYGGRFSRWVHSDDREPYNSWGNGSAMRVSPCGWFAGSLEEAETLAERSAAVTHNHPEGIKGAQATAAAIYLALTLTDRREDLAEFQEVTNRMEGLKNEQLMAVMKERSQMPDPNKAKIKVYIESKYGYDLSRTLDEIRPEYRFDESCQGTVPEAIIAFLESNSFEDAIRNAISLGGDSDTLAAITGSIAEAYYRITSDITMRAFHKLDDSLSAVINNWLDRGKQDGSIISKADWKTKDFSQPHQIKANFQISENNYACIRHGLLPEAMEDKWFAYFDNGRLCFHRSWTGAKIYEAEIHKGDRYYEISEITVERDAEIYKCTSDDEDIRSFNFLVGRGLLGLNVDTPVDTGSDDDVLRGWSSFGNMIL